MSLSPSAAVRFRMSEISYSSCLGASLYVSPHEKTMKHIQNTYLSLSFCQYAVPIRLEVSCKTMRNLQFYTDLRTA